MERLLESFADDPGALIGLVAVVGCIMVGLPAVVLAILATISGTRERERSRREIAAYVAEGNMKAEDASLLLKSEPKSVSG